MMGFIIASLSLILLHPLLSWQKGPLRRVSLVLFRMEETWPLSVGGMAK